MHARASKAPYHRMRVKIGRHFSRSDVWPSRKWPALLMKDGWLFLILMLKELSKICPRSWLNGKKHLCQQCSILLQCLNFFLWFLLLFLESGHVVAMDGVCDGLWAILKSRLGILAVEHLPNKAPVSHAVYYCHIYLNLAVKCW